jgi:hypothetical protein
MREDLLPKTFDTGVSRIVEESGEVIEIIGRVLKITGKLQRFGYIATDSVTGKSYDNVADLFTELDQLEHAICQLRGLWSGKPPERNAKGEWIFPIHLEATVKTRVALSANMKQWLEAFEHSAGREALIMRVVHTYLTTVPRDHLHDILIPALYAMSRDRR